MSKRLLLVILSIALIGFLFWTGSRYPQLNEKAIMGGDIPIFGISFDVVQEVQAEDGVFTQIWKNTINWIDTNKKGMTFGLFFAASLILLFLLVGKRQFENKWANSFIGLVMGAPLGVCVNCATPIAKGMTDAGSKVETALATLISSPTFNVIVLSMLFALVPDYMIFLKISFTLFFILVIIPILVDKFAPPVILETEALGEISEVKFPFEAKEVGLMKSNSTIKDMLWFGWNYLRSFWFIVKTAVPLMLLAGFLGNVFVTFLPLDSIVGLVSTNNLLLGAFLVLGIGMLSTLLPVPMTFDVLATVILMAAGLPPMYAMILLFTLGTFSIYPYFIIHRSISKRLANAMLISVLLLGVVAGIIAHFWGSYEAKKDQEVYDSILSSSTIANVWQSNFEHAFGEIDIPPTDPVVYTSFYEDDQVRIERTPFRENVSDGSAFTKMDGTELGIICPYDYSVINHISPYNNPRSIASGDLNNDGYPDLCVVSSESIYLYYNLEGKSFYSAEIKGIEHNVLNAALADLNGDGWKDIVYSTFLRGAYILYSNEGTYDTNKKVKLPTSYDPVISAEIGFADIDKNGELDIFLGNWNTTLGAQYIMDKAKNEGFYQKNSEWERFDMGTFGGQTHSSLISDINLDGLLDIIEGNDFQAPDVFHINEGNNTFKWVKRMDGMFPVTTGTTMSVISGDIDNDLVPEIYIAQIFTTGAESTDDIEKTCSCFNDPAEVERCKDILTHRSEINQALNKNSIRYCPDRDQEGCKTRFILRRHLRSAGKRVDVPDSILANYPDHSFFNDYLSTFEPMEEGYLRGLNITKEEVRQRNMDAVLFKQNENGNYSEVSKRFNVGKTGWAWNAKFGDINNDAYLDLFVVNGFLFGSTPLQNNIMYINQAGETFENQTNSLGLENFLPCIGYTYIDFDLDGDLDIIVTPSIGPLIIYKNNSIENNNSISLELIASGKVTEATGSKLIINHDGQQQYREILNSGGFKSGDNQTVHYGLGKSNGVNALSITWNDDEIYQNDAGLPAGFKYRIYQK